MKKNLFFVALVALMLVFSFTAVADVTYQNGTITVSPSEDGLHTIKLDGEETGYWVDNVYGSTSFKAEVTDGQHTISFTTIEGSARAPETFWVGEIPEGVDPDATEQPSNPDQPAPVETDGSQDASPEAPVSNGTENSSESTQAAPQITIVEEPTCTTEGKTSDGAALPALGHCYAVESKSNSELKYACVRCGKTMTGGLYDKVANRLGNIVKAENGAVLDYHGYALKDKSDLYTIKVDEYKGSALLYLESAIIGQLYREGYRQVSFINGSAELTFTLSKISKKWFNDAQGIKTYIFQLDANPSGGTLVLVSAATPTETIFASELDGMTLNGKEITRNGVY